MGTLTYLVPGIRSRLDVVPSRDLATPLEWEIVARARSNGKWVEVEHAYANVPVDEATAHDLAAELVSTFAHAHPA
jgi:hypothetical protein